MLANANVVYKKLAAIIIVLSDFNQLYTLIFLLGLYFSIFAS